MEQENIFRTKSGFCQILSVVGNFEISLKKKYLK